LEVLGAVGKTLDLPLADVLQRSADRLRIDAGPQRSTGFELVAEWLHWFGPHIGNAKDARFDSRPHQCPLGGNSNMFPIVARVALKHPLRLNAKRPGQTCSFERQIAPRAMTAACVRWVQHDSSTQYRAMREFDARPGADNRDRHVIALERETCELFELLVARQTGTGWTAPSGARFDLRSNALRPSGGPTPMLPALRSSLGWCVTRKSQRARSTTRSE
jgi:hypothetical protein